ncbi:MAG: SDR family NAD(P)-dependent oxidoreductase [Dongiaceae bacterium]
MMTSPQSILITGASSGIGAALAESYAAPGITLALGGRDKARLEEIVKKCRDKGAIANFSTIDVTDKIAMSSWIGHADKIAPLDLVIANAGVSAGTGGAGEPESQTRLLFATNIDGVINTVFPALEAMKKRKKGQLALMASLAGFRGFPGAPAYCASKAAVKVWGEALRGSLIADGIKVNVLCPGYVDTPMTRVNGFSMPGIMTAEKAAGIIKRGLEANKSRIAFPFSTYFGAWLLQTLPPSWFDWLLTKLPQKGALDLQDTSGL